MRRMLAPCQTQICNINTNTWKTIWIQEEMSSSFLVEYNFHYCPNSPWCLCAFCLYCAGSIIPKNRTTQSCWELYKWIFMFAGLNLNFQQWCASAGWNDNSVSLVTSHAAAGIQRWESGSCILPAWSLVTCRLSGTLTKAQSLEE